MLQRRPQGRLKKKRRLVWLRKKPRDNDKKKRQKDYSPSNLGK